MKRFLGFFALAILYPSLSAQVVDSIIDIRDDRVYNIVKIGAQWWMQENLDAGTYVPVGTNQSDDGIIQKYCYDDNVLNCDTFGGFYLWKEAMQHTQSDEGNPGITRGVCPAGWHLPTDDEWMEMEMHLGMSIEEANKYSAWRGTDEGGKLKSTGTDFWSEPNTGATNISGFTALPVGSGGSSFFSGKGIVCRFWTATAISSDWISWRELAYNESRIYRYDVGLSNSTSVRCIRDSISYGYLTVTDKNLNPVRDLNMNLEKTSDIVLIINISARDDVIISSIFINSSSFILNKSSALLSPGDSIHLTVVFEPLQKGVQYPDTIHIESDDPFMPLITIPLMGYIPDTDTIIDIRDGQSYGVVRIGSQWWMQENMNIGTRIETDPTSISNDIIEKYCHSNDEGKCDVYGGLYSWFEAMDYYPPEDDETGTVQGICPPGWRIPTKTEWEEMRDYLGGFEVAGGKLKATGTDYWGDPNTGATNESGFTGLPGGRRSSGGTFSSEDLSSFMWTATQYDPSKYRYFSLTWNKAWVTTGSDTWSNAHSVRCLCDTNRFSLLAITDPGFKTITDINLTGIHPRDTIILVNSGKGNILSLTSISTYGSAFSLDKSSAVLWPGDSTELAIHFIPTGIGHYTDSIRIESDDPYRPLIHIPLSAWTHNVDSITDLRDGITYRIVKIADEWWMQENLDIGTIIGQDEDGTDNDTIEKKCFGDNPVNCEVYGGLYQWDEMMDYSLPDYGVIGTTRGICPLGWHIPTNQEYTALVDSMGGIHVGGKLKEILDFHWKLPNSGATNESGFSALPGGIHEYSGQYLYQGVQAHFWSAYAWRNFELFHDGEYTLSSSRDKMDAVSVRCKRDPGPMSYLSLRDPDLEPVDELVYYHPKTVDTIVLVHSGAGESLNISSISTAGPAFSASKSAATIPPGDSTMLLVTFNPPDTAIYYDTLTILSDDPYIPSMTIPLLGTFPPEIVWKEINNISCKGFNNGSVRIAPVLGIPPYSINWFGGTMYQDSTFTGMVPDYVYWVDITDSRGWKASDTIVLSEPDTLLTDAFYSDTICLNSAHGFIHCTPSGGIQPYRYAWSTGDSLASLTGLEAGDYKLVVTDDNGCTDTSGYTIESALPFGEEEICIVTVDLLTGRNLIVWEPTADRGIAYYNIYREAERIGVVPFGNLSIFIDTIADPETRPFVYYLSITDTCGNESAKSYYHKPLFLQYVSSIDGVNLRWSHYETGAGEVNFTSYDIYRGSDSLSLSPFASGIPTIVDVYTDKDSEALTRQFFYRVAGILAEPCIPTGNGKAGTIPVNHSLSNMDDNKLLNTGTLEGSGYSAISIRPNPFSGSAWIFFPNREGSDYTLEIYSIQGKLVRKIGGITSGSVIIHRENLEAGLYMVRFCGPRNYTAKLAIE